MDKVKRYRKGKLHKYMEKECVLINLREDEVIKMECRRRRNVDGLLSNCGKIKRNPSLPLCFIEYCVHDLKSGHVRIHFYSNFLTDLMTCIAHKGNSVSGLYLIHVIFLMRGPK